MEVWLRRRVLSEIGGEDSQMHLEGCRPNRARRRERVRKSKREGSGERAEWAREERRAMRRREPRDSGQKRAKRKDNHNQEGRLRQWRVLLALLAGRREAGLWGLGTWQGEKSRDEPQVLAESRGQHELQCANRHPARPGSLETWQYLWLST